MGYYGLTMRSGIEIEDLGPKVKITIPNPEKLRTLGDLVHFENVSFRYPKAAKPVVENVTFTVDQGGRCALIGAVCFPSVLFRDIVPMLNHPQNGQGKSTLAKLVLGELSPTTGTIVRHPLLKIGYFSQHSVEEFSSVEKHVTALEYFLDHFDRKGDKVPEPEARACLGTFGLGGKIASDTPVIMLSGGQKVRV